MNRAKLTTAALLLLSTVALHRQCAALTEEERQRHEHGKEKSVPIQAQPGWLEREYLTGDWNGARAWMQDRGATLEFTYTGEYFGVARGGRNTNRAHEYIGMIDVTFELDTGKAGGWNGGTFFLWMEHLHGRGISAEHLGAFQNITTLEAEPFTQLNEFWYRHAWEDGRHWVEMGKMDANADFAVSDFAGGFVHSSFGAPPNIPFPTFPETGLGLSAHFEPAKWAALQAGIFDGAALGESTFGTRTMFDREGGHIGLFEFHLKPVFAHGKLPGTYRFGAWRHTGAWDEITEAEEPRVFGCNHGLYAVFDQRLFKENDTEGDEQGLGALFKFIWAPEDRNEVTRTIVAGVTYTGAIPGRDKDEAGIGVAHVDFSRRVRRMDGRNRETALEFHYTAEITPFFSVKPVFSAVFNPNGHGRDAYAAGLRWVLKF